MNSKRSEDEPSIETGGPGVAKGAKQGPPVSLTESPPIPPDNYQLRILQSLRRIIRAIEIHSHRLSQDYHITGPQLGCLLVLRDQGQMPLGKLAQALYLSPSTVVGIIDRLEDKGLVQRTRNTPDRRQVNILLTEAGHALTESAPSPLQDTLADSLRQLPELEQVSITLALERVVQLMEAGGISAAPVLETGPLNRPENKPPPGETGSPS